MPDVVKRGYMPSDDKEFIDQIEKLREAGTCKEYFSKRLSVCKDTINQH